MLRCLATPLRIAACFLWLCLPLVFGGAAEAHRKTGDAVRSGVEIPALTHGQMKIVAAYRSDILKLAGRQLHTDETLRRLLNFAALQHAACSWGWLPGSIADEASPFNECSHAYLSALQAAVVHMRLISVDTRPVEDLISRIDMDMVRNGSSFVMCQFSEETFNTASLIVPEWRNVLGHPPSLISLAALALVLPGMAVLAWSSLGVARRREV